MLSAFCDDCTSFQSTQRLKAGLVPGPIKIGIAMAPAICLDSPLKDSMEALPLKTN